MIPLIQPVLYIDPQQETPGAYCEICGGGLYAPSFRCIRCERGAL